MFSLSNSNAVFYTKNKHSYVIFNWAYV